MQLGTGNQSSTVTSAPVCSSILWMQSGIVIHYFYNINDVFSQHWFSTSNLHRVSWNWSFCSQSLHHCSYLILCRFIHVCTFKTLLYIEEAIPTGQITSVCYDHVCQSTM